MNPNIIQFKTSFFISLACLGAAIFVHDEIVVSNDKVTVSQYIAWGLVLEATDTYLRTDISDVVVQRRHASIGSLPTTEYQLVLVTPSLAFTIPNSVFRTHSPERSEVFKQQLQRAIDSSEGYYRRGYPARDVAFLGVVFLVHAIWGRHIMLDKKFNKAKASGLDIMKVANK